MTSTATSSPAAPPRRLDSLTSLRWFAASTVFLLHANEFIVRQDAQLDSVDPASASGRTWFERVAEQGNIGVSFFFILSGFVLAWSWQPGLPKVDFYRRRFARIYPAYLVMCLVAVPVLMALGQVEGMSRFVQSFLPVTLLQAWIPRPGAAYAGNGVSWSLSCEAFFYAIFPFVVVPILRAQKSARAALILGCAAVPLVLALALRPGETDSTTYMFLYVNPIVRSVEFVLGIALAGALRSGVRVRWLRVDTTLIACAAIYLAMGWVPVYLRSVPLTVLPMAALVYAAAQADLDGTAPRWLHAKALVTLGTWSYAFYLVHQLLLNVVREAEPRDAVAIVSIVGAYVVAIGLAAALYRFVEHPMERVLRPSRRATPAVAG